MNIIYPIKKQYARLIFDKTKPFEFRNHIPKNLNIGDIVFVYETKTSGCGKVIGYFEVANIKKINYKCTRVGTYLYMDTYAKMFCDKEVSSMIEKAKRLKIENYYDSFVLSYLFQDEALDYIEKNKQIPPEQENIFFYWNASKEEKEKYDIARQKSREFCDNCDEWLTNIGFYQNDEASWKYEIAIKNATLFKEPIAIQSFLDQKDLFIKVAPQSFCYTKNTPKDFE